MWNRYCHINLPKIRVGRSFTLIFFFEKLTKFWFKNTNECIKNLKLFSEGSLKVASATFLLVCFVCLKKITCETRKNVFLFYYERSFRSWGKYFVFRYSTVMTSSNVQTWNTKHILLNNLGSKQSLLMKYGQFM